MVAEHSAEQPYIGYTIRRFAQETQKSEYAVRTLIRKGKVPVVYIGERSPRIPTAFVEALREGRITL